MPVLLYDQRVPGSNWSVSSLMSGIQSFTLRQRARDCRSHSGVK
jgi:hypothetical protein